MSIFPHSKYQKNPNLPPFLQSIHIPTRLRYINSSTYFTKGRLRENDILQRKRQRYAALPLGAFIGFDTASGETFGIFAGTAVNDTSSVTAAASTWDSMYALGSQTLDKAVTVKLTRTLAIIPITLILAIWQSHVRSRKSDSAGASEEKQSGFNLRKSFPMFILYFIIASVITTIAISAGVSAEIFTPLKELSKFMIVMAMAAIGLNSNIVKLIKTGGKPLMLGFCCWAGISLMSLLVQHLLGLI